jgi:hypothetical protein
MPWTAKSRAVAWRRVNAEPDTPRSVIAAELGVSAKALRDLIKEKERETGERLKKRKPGRPRGAQEDFVAVAEEVLRLYASGFPEDRLYKMRRAYHRLFDPVSTLPRASSREEKLLSRVRSPAALGILFRVYGSIMRSEGAFGSADLTGSKEEIRAQAAAIERRFGVKAIKGNQTLFDGYAVSFLEPFRADRSRWKRPSWHEAALMWWQISGELSRQGREGKVSDAALYRAALQLRDAVRRSLRRLRSIPDTRKMALALEELLLSRVKKDDDESRQMPRLAFTSQDLAKLRASATRDQEAWEQVHEKLTASRARKPRSAT